MSDAYEIEAGKWVVTEISRLRALSYADLVEEEKTQHREMTAPDGKPFILETQTVWDDREAKNLRVMVDVWDPSKRVSLRSIAKDDFIRAPDGSFVGEAS